MLNLGRLRPELLLLLYMGAEFSDVALPFGETEEDAHVGRNGTGHWPFARAT